MNENKWINMAHFVLRNYINLNTKKKIDITYLWIIAPFLCLIGKKKEEKNTSEAIVRNLGT